MFAERGAMALMSDGVNVKGAIPGGIIKGFIRRELGNESFFFAEYTASVDGAWVGVATKFPGDMTVIDLEQTGPLYLVVGSVVAWDEQVEVDTKVGSVGSVAMKGGLFLLGATGSGVLIVGSYGGMQKIEVARGDRLIIDTGHLVAWGQSMDFKIGPLGGLVTQALSGEGLVAEISGPGMVLVQTRAEQGLRNWILNPAGGQNTGGGK